MPQDAVRVVRSSVPARAAGRFERLRRVSRSLRPNGRRRAALGGASTTCAVVMAAAFARPAGPASSAANPQRGTLPSPTAGAATAPATKPSLPAPAAAREEELDRLRRAYTPPAAAPAPPAAPATSPATAPAPKPGAPTAPSEGDNPGPAALDASAAWGLANEFIARQKFAPKYSTKGSSVQRKSKGVFDVGFTPRDKADAGVTVRVDLRTRRCAVAEPGRAGQVED
jgi:hypothetical protein